MGTVRMTLAITLAATVLGCTSEQPRDKVGNTTRVLHLATIDAVNETGTAHGPEAFVAALEDVSGGRLQVEVDADTFGDGSVGAESRLVAAIASGEVDGGWPSTRAFARAGIEGLEVVEAPLVLDSYDALRTVVRSSTADTLLRRLEGSGVRGLALAVGSLRRPFGVRPLLGPEDWAGSRFRAYNSEVQEDTITALGGTPVGVGYGWLRQAANGHLDGVEFDVAQYFSNGQTIEAGHLTGNVVLWPKVWVLSLSEQLHQELSPEEREWVAQAADLAAAASVEGEYEYDEQTIVRLLCQDGLQVHSADDEQVAALRAAVQPVLDDLADDPVLAELQMIAARHPGPDTFDPVACVPEPVIEQAGEIAVPRGDPGIPAGTYRSTLTPEMLHDTGIGPRVDGWSGTWTLTIDDGGYQIDCTPLAGSVGNDCNFAARLPDGFDYNPREVGQVTGDARRAWFTHDPAREAALTDCTWPERQADPEPCFPRVVNEVRWRHTDGALVFSELRTDLEPTISLVAGPWQQIG